MYQCQVENCGRTFEKPHGLKVHSYKAHGNNVAPKRKSNLANSLVSVLLNSENHTMNMTDIANKIKEFGISCGRRSITTQVSQKVKHYPDMGIKRVKRGTYTINPEKGKKFLNDFQEADLSPNISQNVKEKENTSDVSFEQFIKTCPQECKSQFLALENVRLQRKLRATQDIVMAITRLMAMSMCNEDGE